MTFVNFSMLIGGSVLVGLPIVLHLIMRRKPRHHEFPALRFVRKRHETNQRRLRLRHLVLLALRMLAIFLVGAALARPSMKLSGSFGSRKTPVAAAFVVDSSMRMEYTHEEATRLEVAGELAAWVMNQLPDESEVAVLDSRRGPAAFQVDEAAARYRLDRLEPTAAGRPLSHAVSDAVELLSTSELSRRELYVFTDMARAAWPKDAAATLQRELAKLADLGIYIIDLGVPDPVNTAILPLRLSDQVLAEGTSLKIDADITHQGPAISRTVELYFADPRPSGTGSELNGVRKRSEQIVALESGQGVGVHFAVGGLRQGTHQGYVRIVGQDGLACDDQRWFTVRVQPAWRVLLVAMEPTQDHAIYLREALAPTSFRQAGLAQFDCETIAFGKLADKSLAGYDAVFLLDPPALESAIWETLTDYVASGHGLGIALGRHARDIEALNRKIPQEVLPARLVRQARAAAPGVHLLPRDLEHPALAAFREWEGSIPWRMSPILRYWQLGPPAEGVNVVVPYSDGRPAVLDRTVGRGHVLTVTTSLSDLPGERPWNQLWAGEAAITMVMLSDGMARYLVGSSDQTLNYTAGQTAVLKLDAGRPRPSYSLTTPDGLDLRLTPDLNRHLLSVASTEVIGNYRVRAGGYDDPVDLGFSVNLAADQTELARLADDDLQSIFGEAAYQVARSREEVEVGVTTGRVGQELFPLLILLLALTLGVEYFVANRFYRV